MAKLGGSVKTLIDLDKISAEEGTHSLREGREGQPHLPVS
jgi:hypothetical protein